MTFTEISKSKFAGDVVIIGNAGSGKTKLSGELALTHATHKVFHADGYMSNGYELGMYELMTDIKNHDGPKIVEGVNCFRLLRKGLQTGEFNPDNVIHMHAPVNSVKRTYHNERLGRDFKYIEGQNKSNDKVMSDYRKLKDRISTPPAFHEVDNVY